MIFFASENGRSIISSDVTLSPQIVDGLLYPICFTSERFTTALSDNTSSKSWQNGGNSGADPDFLLFSLAFSLLSFKFLGFQT